MKGVYKVVRTCDSEVPRNDAEHGESLGDIDITDALFCRFVLAFVGRRRARCGFPRQCRIPFVAFESLL